MDEPKPRLELLTIGRASVDLYGEQVGGRLEDMGSFAKYVGGSPTNTAVGAARLGLGTGLLTRVGGAGRGSFACSSAPQPSAASASAPLHAPTAMPLPSAIAAESSRTASRPPAP